MNDEPNLTEKSDDRYSNLSPLINARELMQLSELTDFILVDASFGPTARTNYETMHLKNALFIDLNSELAEIDTDVAKGGRHPLPNISNFAKTVGELGISPDSHVIIYDAKNGSLAAARFWWMLKAIGHAKVQVLNGGIQQALAINFPTSSGFENRNSRTPYPVDQWLLPIATMDEVEHVANRSDFRVIDVRESDRYNGITEPIDLIAGHIPGAINIPFTENLDDDGLFLPPAILKKKYEKEIENRTSENVIFHCGSGVTACHSLLALAYAGFEIPKLYVGSWSEWSRNNKKMVTK